MFELFLARCMVSPNIVEVTNRQVTVILAANIIPKVLGT